MNFKATKKKIVISIGVIVLWYVLMLIFASLFHCSYYPCPSTYKASDCEKVFVFNIIPEFCGGGCTCSQSTPISEIIIQLITILFPGILVYVVWSLVEKGK